MSHGKRQARRAKRYRERMRRLRSPMRVLVCDQTTERWADRVAGTIVRGWIDAITDTLEQ